MVQTHALFALTGFCVVAEIADDEVAQLQHVRFSNTDEFRNVELATQTEAEFLDDHDESVQLLDASMEREELTNPYKVTNFGSTSCPAGFGPVSTEAECKTASTSMSKTWGKIAAWGNIQGGCFTHQNNYVWWNTNATGRTHNTFSSVCIKSGCVPTEYRGYIAGHQPAGGSHNGKCVSKQECFNRCASMSDCKAVDMGENQPSCGPDEFLCNIRNCDPATDAACRLAIRNPAWGTIYSCDSAAVPTPAPTPPPTEACTDSTLTANCLASSIPGLVHHVSKKSWTAARDACIADGKTLAYAKDGCGLAEMQKAMADNVWAWIDATDAAQEGTWLSSDGSTPYLCWGGPNPNNGGGNFEEDCALLYSKASGGMAFYMNDGMCSVPLEYFCMDA